MEELATCDLEETLELLRFSLAGCAYKEPLLPSEWVQANIPNPNGSGYLQLYPFQIEPLDCLVDPQVSSVALQWGAQLTGKTLILVCAILYVAANLLGPLMMVSPTEELITAFVKDRLNSLLIDVREVRDVLEPLNELGRGAHANKRQNLLHKILPGAG